AGTGVIPSGPWCCNPPLGWGGRGDGHGWFGGAPPGPVTERLRAELTGIQDGSRPDPFGWVHKIA
ncbi:branched chain amino acid aminotransferase, partial [Streptomyces sp. NPDC058953]